MSLPFPLLNNVPFKSITTFGSPYNITDCNEWYLYRFDNSSDVQAQMFFGSNHGTPISSPVSKGMLTNGKNIAAVPCWEVNRTVPYFIEQSKRDNEDYNESINEFVYRKLLKLRSYPIEPTRKSS